MQPDTRYAKSGEVHIAYQIFGEGPINLVLASPFVSNVEHWWDEPDVARWLLRLASFARVVMLDKRGTGMSDRGADLPGLDQRIDDLRAVMDAAAMDKAALLGISEGGPLTALFAATYPNRCQALVLYGSFARFSSWFPTEEALALEVGAAVAGPYEVGDFDIRRNCEASQCIPRCRDCERRVPQQTVAEPLDFRIERHGSWEI